MYSFITFIRNLLSYAIGTRIGKCLIIGFFIFIIIAISSGDDDECENNI